MRHSEQGSVIADFLVTNGHVGGHIIPLSQRLDRMIQNETRDPNCGIGRASVSLSYVTIAFNVARPFCLMDVAEF